MRRRGRKPNHELEDVDYFKVPEELWGSADDLIVSIVIERPNLEPTEQHLCADKGHDYGDVRQVIA